MITQRIGVYGTAVFVSIKTEDKYCGEACVWKREKPLQCILFEKHLERCLGGGPLRCAACLEAEKQTKEIKP